MFHISNIHLPIKDQGAEMAQHVELKNDTGLDIYFCEPRRPWQRGTTENTNGLLRQYFPKGTYLGRYTADELAADRRFSSWRTGSVSNSRKNR